MGLIFRLKEDKGMSEDHNRQPEELNIVKYAESLVHKECKVLNFSLINFPLLQKLILHHIIFPNN
jgi:hypothetical protein